MNAADPLSRRLPTLAARTLVLLAVAAGISGCAAKWKCIEGRAWQFDALVRQTFDRQEKALRYGLHDVRRSVERVKNLGL